MTIRPEGPRFGKSLFGETLMKALKEAVENEREFCAKIAEAESECNGPMPDELRLAPIEDVVRAAIRATKVSIATAIRQSGGKK